MANVISLVNQKGGVTKSTTAVNLGAGLARQGKRVLIIDADSQGNATQMLGWQQPDELSFTLATFMEMYMAESPIPYSSGILHYSEGLDLIPANIELSLMEAILVNTMSRENVLKEVIQEVKPHYDTILIDCPPSLSMMTINALAAADSVIIPVQAHYLPARGLEQLLKTIGRIRKQINPSLQIDGILLTMVGRNNFSKNIGELLENTYGKELRIYNTKIPYSIRGAEMSATGKSIFEYEPQGKVAAAYRDLVKEVLNHGEKSVTKHKSEISR